MKSIQKVFQRKRYLQRSVINSKIKKQLETKRVRKWIKFKSNKHVRRANTRAKSTHLVSPKTKEGELPSKDIVFFNKDQREEILPSKERLKLIENRGKVTYNHQQRKRKKTYADAVASIMDNSELCYKTKSDNGTTPNKNKKKNENKKPKK